MKCYFTRLQVGQTRYGVFSNLWGELGREDRQCLGVWYLTVH